MNKTNISAEPKLPLQELTATKNLIAGLHDRKVRVVRNNGFRKSRELHPLLAQLVDFVDDLIDCPLTAIQDGIQLDCCGFNNSHCTLLSPRCSAALSSFSRVFRIYMH